jgi:anti-sigma B factor antagonist
MEAEVTAYKRCDVVKMSGRVDSNTAPILGKALNTVTEAGRYKIVFDMSEVNFMSSAGWWVLIDTQKTCRRYKRGELVLANVDSGIRASLDLVGMGSYFKIFDDVTSAVGSF